MNILSSFFFFFFFFLIVKFSGLILISLTTDSNLKMETVSSLQTLVAIYKITTEITLFFFPLLVHPESLILLVATLLENGHFKGQYSALCSPYWFVQGSSPSHSLCLYYPSARHTLLPWRWKLEVFPKH
jgi:hypothetical protein